MTIAHYLADHLPEEDTHVEVCQLRIIRACDLPPLLGDSVKWLLQYGYYNLYVALQGYVITYGTETYFVDYQGRSTRPFPWRNASPVMIVASGYARKGVSTPEGCELRHDR